MFTWNSHYENFEIFVEYEKHYYILIFSHTQLKKVELYGCKHAKYHSELLDNYNLEHD